MKKELLKFKDINVCTKLDVNMLNLQSVLLSKVNGYKAVYENCDNFSSLENSLADTYKHVLERVYRSIGIDLLGLTKNQKKFLLMYENQ